MDPGEQTTGTRDEHFNLVSVLYHALHGAENCTTYALDAEAAGDERLLAFFREAGVVQARLAERAKGLLGIPEVRPEPQVRPESASPSGTAPRDVPPRSDEVPLSTGSLPPTTGVPRTSSGQDRSSPSGALPDPDLVLREEDVVTPEDTSSATDQAATGRIVPEDFDSTISALESGVTRLAIGRALAEIETWERKLEATGDPELESIAGNLGALRALLSADDIDVAAAGPLLMTLGEQVQGVASGGVGAQVAGKLQRLSELLMGEGRSLS